MSKKKNTKQAFDVAMVLQAIQDNPELLASITAQAQGKGKSKSKSKTSDSDKEKFRQIRWALFTGLKEIDGVDRLRYRGGFVFFRKEKSNDDGYLYYSVEINREKQYIILFRSEFESRQVINRTTIQKVKYGKTGVAKILSTVATL